MHYKIHNSQSTKILFHALPLQSNTNAKHISSDTKQFYLHSINIQCTGTNNYILSTLYNQRNLRPRSASKTALNQITLLSLSNHLYQCDRGSVCTDKCHMTTNLPVYAIQCENLLSLESSTYCSSVPDK